MMSTHSDLIHPAKKHKHDDGMCDDGASSNDSVDFGASGVTGPFDDANSNHSFNGNDEAMDVEVFPEEILTGSFVEEDHDDGADDWAMSWNENLTSEHFSKGQDPGIMNHDNNPALGLGFIYKDFEFLKRHDPSKDMFELDQNQQYFYSKCKAKEMDPNDGTGGWCSLVHRGCTGNRNDNTKSASPETAELFHKLNSALMNASQGEETEVIMDLCNSLITRMQNKVDEHLGENSILIQPDKNWPKDISDARRILLDGRHSVMRNFPAPKVIQIGDHAVVKSLKEVIQIHAGHHGEFEFAYDASKTGTRRSKNGLNGTKACETLANRVYSRLKEGSAVVSKPDGTSIGFITFWSDSFLNSFIKQKDNSVWLFCVTISPPPEDISRGTFTQVLAMGRSGQDHSDVISHFYDQLEELERGFPCYFGNDNTIRDVAFSLLYHSADRPERHNIQNVLDEGHFGKVTNYAVSISTEMLPACIDCYKDLVGRLNDGKDIPKRRCNKCFCWDIDPEDKAQEVTPVKDDYPKEPKKIDAGGFLAKEVLPPIGRVPGSEYIGPVRLSTTWLIQACTFAYEARRLNIWSNRAVFDEYLRTCCLSQARRDIINEIATRDRKEKTHTNPEGYIPKFWCYRDCFHGSLFPDMPLHALAHGMGGDVIEFFHGILTGFKRGNGFGNFVNATISDVASFGLDWCKPKKYPKSAWVGENIMAFLRLFSYLYGTYLLNHPLNKDHEALQDSMKRMINAFQSMTSYLMSMEPGDTSIVRDRVKLFMSASHFCDKAYIPPKEVVDKGKSSSSVVVDQLSGDEVTSLLRLMQVPEGNVNQRSTLDGVTMPRLKELLEAKNLPITGNKSQLQLRLFNAFLDREITMVNSGESGSTNSADGGANVEQQKKWVWDKGAWLSFVTNIEWQINLLGPLRLIW